MKSKVIQLDCPYKGKHKYELSPIELKDYERIKKIIQRSKNTEHGAILQLWVRIATKYEYTWDENKQDCINKVRYEPCNSYNFKNPKHWIIKWVSENYTKEFGEPDKNEWKLIERGAWIFQDNGNSKWHHISGMNYYDKFI